MGAKHSKLVQHDSSVLPTIDESREVHFPYVQINPWHAYIRCRFRRQSPRCRTISDRAVLRIIESDALLREAHTGANIPAAVAAFLVDPDNVARTLGMLTTGPTSGPASPLHPKAHEAAKAMLTKALTRRRHRARNTTTPSALRPIGGVVHKGHAAVKRTGGPAANGAAQVSCGAGLPNGGPAHVNRAGVAVANGGADANRGGGVPATNGGTSTTPRAGAANGAFNGATNGRATAAAAGAVVKGTPGRRPPPPPPPPGQGGRRALSWWSRIMVAVTVVALFQSRPRLGHRRGR